MKKKEKKNSKYTKIYVTDVIILVYTRRDGYKNLDTPNNRKLNLAITLKPYKPIPNCIIHNIILNNAR
jgi:hypothetical protein